MSKRKASRRILGSFGADSSIEGIDLNVRAKDVALLLTALFTGLVLFDLAGHAGSWVLTAVGVIVAFALPITAGVLVFVTPRRETSAVAWVRHLFGYWRQESERSIVAISPENRPDALTQVRCIHPTVDAVERTDGDLVGGVRVDPANMSLATTDKWETVADEFGDAINSLEFDVFVYSTARHIDCDGMLAAYDGRESDPDVTNNETLCQLVTMYRTQLADEFKGFGRDTSVREYYILVSIAERDVQVSTYGVLEHLTSLPVGGDLIKTIGGVGANMSEAETTGAQARKLSDRIEDVEDAMEGVSECSTEVLAASDIAGAIDEFWTGNRSGFTDGTEQIRSMPVVVSETNESVSE